MVDIWRLRVIAGIFGLLSLPTHGQVPMAELDALSPAGAKVGTIALLQAHGSALDELAGVLVSDPRVSGVIENGQVRLEIPDDLEPSIIDVAVHGRFGVSNPRAFAIGSLAEVQEMGEHQKREAAQKLAIGQTVNGAASVTAVDWYEFVPPTTEPVYIDVLAERLDSRMDPTLVIVDAEGHEVARHHDVRGRDVSVSFTPTQPNKPYYLALHDFLYEGGNGYFYRLSLTKAPLVINGPIRVPANLPVAALKEESNHDSGETLVTRQASIVGQVSAGEERHVDVLLEEAGPVVIELFSERLGHPSDFRLHVSKVEKEGKLSKVVENDDLGDRVKNKRFRLGSRDPMVTLKAQAKVRYRIVWKNQFNTATPYRLELREPKPDVYLMAAAEKPGEVAQQLTRWTPILRRGGTAHWQILAMRRDGFDGAITVRPKNLPEGVTALPLILAKGQHQGALILTASSEAPSFAGLLELAGEMSIAGEKITRPVLGAHLLWSIGDANRERWEGRLTASPSLAVLAQETAPLTLVPAETHFETCLGGKLELPFNIERAMGQAGNFKMKLVGLPGLAKSPEVSFDPNAKEVKLNLNVFNRDNNKFVPGDYRVHTRAWEGKVKHRVNPEAAERAAEDQKTKEAAEKEAAAKLKALEEANATEAEREKAKETLEAARKAKEAAVKRAEEAKKQAAPRDLLHAVVSHPISLKITEGPIKLGSLPSLTGQAGGETSLKISLERLYGFGDSVAFTLSSPKDTKVFEAVKGSVAKESTEAELKVPLSKEAKPGTYEATLDATLKFNGQDITLKRTITLTIS